MHFLIKSHFLDFSAVASSGLCYVSLMLILIDSLKDVINVTTLLQNSRAGL